MVSGGERETMRTSIRGNWTSKIRAFFRRGRRQPLIEARRSKEDISIPELSSPASSPDPGQKRKILLIGSLAAWGVFVFMAFFILNFPGSLLAEHVLEAASQATGVGISAQNSDFSPPARLSYEGLHLVTPSPEGPLDWEIPRATGAASLISLATGKPRFNFDVKAYGGEFRGRLQQARHGTWNHLKGKTIRPIDLLMAKKLIRQNLSGLLNLETDYTWTKGSEQRGHGMLALRIRDLVIHDLNINGFPLPDLIFQKVRGRVFLHDGQGRLETLTADGPLAHVTGTGTIMLNVPYNRSVIDLDLHARLRGQLKSLPLPSVESNPDHTLHIHLQGPLSTPTVALNGLTVSR